MKNLRFLHTGDWHADSDPVKQAKLKLSLDQMLDYVSRNQVDAIIHTGDIWERKQSYSSVDKSGVPLIHEYLKKLSKLVDFIFIVKGNNSHDEPGSVSLLHQLEPNIYAYEYPVVLFVPDEKCWGITDLLREDKKGIAQFIISLVPYPQKSGFITNTSIDNNNNDFLEKFEQMFELIGDITESYTCPKLLGFHGNVVGSRLSSGQTLVSQDIMVAPSTLEKAKANYYALGHIHLRQEIKPNMIYSGSIYNKNWGETEQKSFEIVEIGNLGVLQYTWELAVARPMVKLDLIFNDGNILDAESGDEYHGYVFLENNNDEPEFRLRIKVLENEIKLMTDEKISELKNFFGQDAKIEIITIPNERESRSEKIMDCKSLLDEVKEYAAIVNHTINGTIGEKVIAIQEASL